MRSDSFHLVLSQEPGDPSVVRALGPGVVEGAPADVELLPAIDSSRAHSRDRNPIRPTPTRVEQAIDSDRNTHDEHGRLGHE
jgi:hypothetical protein